jgi:hypothetical protein
MSFSQLSWALPDSGDSDGAPLQTLVCRHQQTPAVLPPTQPVRLAGMAAAGVPIRTSWAPIYRLTAGQGDWRRVPVAALLREGGGHLLGISRGAASPPGPDLWLWRPEMGQCWSLRANQARLMAEGVCGVRRCLRPLGKARRVLAA